MASGGLREMIPAIGRTVVAVGVDGIFMEVGPSLARMPNQWTSPERY